MPSKIHKNGGFTLIELMIAVGLGMLIVYAATAGLRVASQSVTNANRLALENSMLRIGYEQALDEIDFWTAYDKPHSTDASEQALRKAAMPFSPLPPLQSIQANTGGIPAQAILNYPSPETDTGWDPLYMWPANDPRTWWRANPAQRWRDPVKQKDPYSRNGDYALFADNNGSPHPWLFKQMEMLHKSLGWYAYCDYLPPSMLYAYMDNGFMNKDFTRPGTFRNGDGGTEFAQGRYRCTKDTSYIITPLIPLAGASKVTPANNRVKYNTGVGAQEKHVDNLMNLSLSSESQLLIRPEHWPDVRVEVSRFLCHNRFVTLNRIQWTSAHTGKTINLNFTALGTTLRGARQQRKIGGPGSGQGWAEWYGPNEGYGNGNGQNDYHLDYLPPQP